MTVTEHWKKRGRGGKGVDKPRTERERETTNRVSFCQVGPLPPYLPLFGAGEMRGWLKGSGVKLAATVEYCDNLRHSLSVDCVSAVCVCW